MALFNLDTFLREHTFYEKFILSNINPSDINSLKSFIKNTEFNENIMRKFPIQSGISIEDFFLGLKETNSKTILTRRDDIVFVCHPRFAKTAEHHHNYIEMIYVYSGEFHQTVNGSNIIMKKGEFCILDTNVMHSIEPTSENDIIINCIMSKKHLDDILLNRLSGNDLISSFFIHTIYQSNDYMLFKSEDSEKLARLMDDVLDGSPSLSRRRPARY